MRTPRRHRLAGLSVAALALLATACGQTGDQTSGTAAPDTAASGTPQRQRVFGPPDAPNPVDGGKVVIGLEAETEAVDPLRIPIAVSGHMVASAIYDPLVTLDEQGKAVPFLAEAIDGSADHKTWTFTLRQGVVFHNGTPFDATVLKANLEAYRKSAVTSLGFQFFDTVTVTDPTHVVVTLTQPMVSFPLIFVTQAGYIMEPSMLDNPEAAATNPIGTGPFVFDSRVKDQYWRLKKNPNYWRKTADGKPLPHLDTLELRPIPDEAERLQSLERGDVDLIHTNKPEQVLDLRASSYKRVEYDNGEKDFIVLNTEQPPFDNLNARKAVAYATDYATWRDQIQMGVKPKATGPLSPGQPGYEEDTGFPSFDLAKAKELVAAYTAETGQPLSFTYYARDDVQNIRDAQALKAMWEAAGMQVELSAYPQIQLIARVATGGYQLSEWRLFGDPEPDAVTIWMRSTSILPPPGVSLNFPRFKDAELDGYIDTALAATDEQAKADAMRNLSRRLGETVPYIWLGRVDWILAGSDRLNGISPAQNGSVQTLGPKTWLGELWLSR